MHVPGETGLHQLSWATHSCFGKNALGTGSIISVEKTSLVRKRTRSWGIDTSFRIGAERTVKHSED